MFTQIIIKVLLFFLLAFQSKCERRIVDGEEVDRSQKFNKAYVVYIVWDAGGKLFHKYYEHNPICGGSLLKADIVLTSAACLRHYPIQYVVAGYNRFVPGAIGRDELERQCLEIAKKVIVQKCYCDPFDMTYKKTEWFINDVALARTDKPYDLNDDLFAKLCSYKPTTIKLHRQKVPDLTDAMMFGWGSSKYHLPPNTSFDINQIHLRGTTTKILSTTLCKKRTQPHHFVLKDRYCTDGVSLLNIYGEPKDSLRRTNTTKNKSGHTTKSIEQINRNESRSLPNTPIATRETGTTTIVQPTNSIQTINSNESHPWVNKLIATRETENTTAEQTSVNMQKINHNESQPLLKTLISIRGTETTATLQTNKSRQQINRNESHTLPNTLNTTRETETNKPVHTTESMQQINSNESHPLLNTLIFTRKTGTVCQNDHGGPLVTWIEGKEVIIGVIINSLVSSKMECVNPSVHASIKYFGNFIECGLMYFNGLKISPDEDCVIKKRWSEEYCQKFDLECVIGKIFPVLLLINHLSKCQRRIVDGEEVYWQHKYNKAYVVYIVWELHGKVYKQLHEVNPLCGGTLLRSDVVLTAATCLKHYPAQHVIAGYNRYIPGGKGRDAVEKRCLKLARRTIIEKCYCEPFDITYNKSSWFVNDVALARLNIPYDLNDETFLGACSYIPKTIPYYSTRVPDGTNVMMLGWGSVRYRVPENVSYDVNEFVLRATTTKTINLDECERVSWPHDFHLHHRYCTDGVSSLDIYGVPKSQKTEQRRSISYNDTEDISMEEMVNNDTIPLFNEFGKFTRRNTPAACQNDHGGPLVAWIEGEEMVIGVIISSLVNSKMECVNPSVHASLSYFGNFVTCGLTYFEGLPVNPEEDCAVKKRFNESFCTKIVLDW